MTTFNGPLRNVAEFKNNKLSDVAVGYAAGFESDFFLSDTWVMSPAGSSFQVVVYREWSGQLGKVAPLVMTIS